MIRALTAAGVIAFFPLTATELLPWYPRSFEFQWLSAYSHQTYNKVDISGESVSISCNGNYVDQSLTLSYAEWCGEIEASFAASCYRNFGGDRVKATIRYQMSDDISGDWATTVAGASIAGVFAPSLSDVTLFRHGALEGEFHIAIGKEFASWRRWEWRGWAAGGIGIADHGSPWLFGRLAVDMNICDWQIVALYTRAEHGLGGRALNLQDCFSGYGGIDYTGVDAGIAYSILINSTATLCFDYSCRFFARNAPKGSHLAKISYNYPFSL